MIFRYSSVNTSFECLAKYKSIYLDGIEQPKGADAEFGTAMHLGIKTILEGGDGITIFNLYWDSMQYTKMKYYRFNWAQLSNIGNKLLPRFERLHSKKLKVHSLEKEMQMPICGEHIFQGTTDFLGYYGGVPSVIDWKTSTQKYKDHVIERNPQLYGYARLARTVLGFEAKQVIYKVFVKSDESIQTLISPLTPAKEDRMIEILEQQIGDLASRQIFPPNPSCFCPHPEACFGNGG